MISNLENPAIGPALPAPVPRRGRLSLLQFLGTLQDNMIDVFTEEAYEEDIVHRKVLGRDLFIINDPALVKYVLLDNVANYEKTEIVRRILEPGLGKGLITLEKDTWRAHRRTMAPSFDHRSIAAYTPIMTTATEEMLAEWAQLGPGGGVDVEHAMMEVTLHIISRTMFSSDSNSIVRIMGGAAGLYQSRVRPNILDLFNVPNWLAGRRRARLAKQTFAEFDAICDRLIDERVRNPGNSPKDLLARLIAARDEQTGVGMSAEVCAKALDPFFTTKPVGQGTGLGLSTTYGFVTQSGGRLLLDSVPGQGTTITILLPAAAARAPGNVRQGVEA